MISLRSNQVPSQPATGKSIVERMADDMADMRAAGQLVTNEALAVWGDWSSAEVERHAREAADLARSRAVRQLAVA